LFAQILSNQTRVKHIDDKSERESRCDPIKKGACYALGILLHYDFNLFSR